MAKSQDIKALTGGHTSTRMPKLACPCGFVHNLSPIPDEGWLTVRDRDFDTVVDAEMESRVSPLSASPMHLCGVIYECPKCGRLMWEKPGEKRFVVYHPEK